MAEQLKVRGLILVATVLLLSGCGLKRPPLHEINTADFGSPPDSSEAAVREYLEDVLFDPYSAVIKCGEPKKGWVNHLGDIYFGWIVWCSVNAKNRFGAYTGVKKYHYLFQDNEIIKNIWATQEYVE